MSRVLTVAAGLAVAAALASCGGGGGSSSSSAPSLDGTLWRLVTVAGAAAQPGGTLEFVGHGTLNGSTGCNSFQGTYAQSGDSLTIKPGATTLIGCPPPLDAQERAVLAALPKTSTFTEKGSTLTLLDASGKALLAYAHMSSPLAGATFEVTGINNGKQAVVSVIAGTSLTARFSDDGHVTGSAGCNTYSATYTLDGTTLHVGPPISTRKACSSPAGVMEQETQFLHALERSTIVQPGGNTVFLRDAEDAIQITLSPPG